MQHKDRESLIDGFLTAVEDNGGARLGLPGGNSVRQRLDHLLDDFLLESRPPQVAEVTILLVDIRGFTAMVESHPRALVADMLNHYFAAMTQVVIDHGGAIDKFMGDSVMALFGAPELVPDGVQRAVACAVQMQRAMTALSRANEERGQPQLHVGIGINTGKVMAGSFGSSLHNEFTVIGDEVNLAARIEPFSLRGQVLLSENTYSKVKDMVEIGNVNRVTVKGKRDPVAMYEVIALTEPQRVEVPRVEQRKSPRVNVDLPVIFRKVQNERVLPEKHQGRVVDLSYSGLRIELLEHLDPLSEIVLTVLPDLSTDNSGTLYAKVLWLHECEGGRQGQFEFTTVNTPAHHAIKGYVDQILWGQ